MASASQPSHGPVQTSAVVVLGASSCLAIPPPSPPTPSSSPPGDTFCEPIDPLSLDRELRGESAIKDQRLREGIHVLNTEALALRNLSRLYTTDPIARDGFSSSVQTIIKQQAANGKLVIIGVGKSGHIGQKLVATFKSLAIPAVFLHPTEALHGDLGIIGCNDALMFITYSGKTQELLIMLPHIDESLPTILLTSHTAPETCEFMNHRPNTILLPAPIPEPEKISFGVSAPTTSTTVALAIGDAIAVTAAKEINASIAAVFAKNHPGGAIGAAARHPRTIKDIAVRWCDIPIAGQTENESFGFDLLRAGLDSVTGWVRVQDRVASPSTIRKISRHDLNKKLEDIPDAMMSKAMMLSLSSETTIRQARDILKNTKLTRDDEDLACGREAAIAVMEKGEIVGVLEVASLLDFEEQ
ncbi:arabinose 5-phosphate isomerase [Fusarium beomiforme]|uniref:Arabinose 5-phosphate isomerase n=1 Tax=Fusarium beomiforme TaxID=44412 RepID=A0A9P5ATK4_9HYPO|nr:arabinose 5-phosphate isomerase [Fusarium beomiforme]